MNNFIEMEYEEWVETYKPIPNNIDKDASFDGMMFETLLSAAAFLPDTATATWGVSRGDSTDFADFAPVHIARKGTLPNRQSGIVFTKEILFQ
jgi:hypothetical protein